MSSFTKGISFRHECNSSSQPTINNNISISNNNESSERFSVKVEQPIEEVEQVKEHSTILNETEFLRKVLNIYMNQKLYWQNKFLILSPDELLELIQTLLPDKSIVITSNELDDVNCCGFVKDIPIRKVDSIWIDEDNNKQSFKYQYSNLVSLFDQYKISIKYVRFQ